RADGLDIQWTLACGYRFWRTDRTGGIDLRIRRLGVRVPPSAPRSTANPGRTSSRCGSSCSGKVQQYLAVKLLSQPVKRFAGGLVGNLGVDFHCDRDLAVAEYPHRYPRHANHLGPGRSIPRCCHASVCGSRYLVLRDTPDVVIHPFRKDATIAAVLDRADLPRKDEELGLAESVAEHLRDLGRRVPP